MADNSPVNPLAQFGDPGTPASATTTSETPASTTPPPASNNPFAQFGNPGSAPQSSTLGAASRAAIQGILPTLGGLPAAGAGAEAGAALGSVVGPVGTAVGGVVGGVAGFAAGGAAVAKVQDWALKQLPPSWQDALGASDRQQQIDQQQHPISTMLGGLAPYALTMSPVSAAKVLGNLPADATAFQRIMANPVTARVFGGLGMGGMELGQEKVEGQPVNWTRVAISTGFGTVFNRPYSWGEKLTALGAELAPRTPIETVPEVTATVQNGQSHAPDFGPGWQYNANVDHTLINPGDTIVHTNTTHGGPESGVVTAINPYGPENPGFEFKSADGYEGFTPQNQVTGTLTPVAAHTVADAADAKVMGPGITEAVFQGEHVQDPNAEAAAQRRSSTEQSLIGPAPVPPDVHDLARRMNPELFEQYDALQEQHAAMRQWVAEQSNPTDNMISEAQKSVADIQANIDALPSYSGAEGRRLRAQFRDAQGQVNDLNSRREAWTSGTAEITPEMQQARLHLLDLEHQIWDTSEQVRAAYRSAADSAGSEVVAPSEEPVSSEEAVPSAQERGAKTIQETKPITDQQRIIANDVADQLEASGRPSDESQASGQVIAHYYTTRAARFKGALGSPLELYRAQGSEIVPGKGVVPVLDREMAQKGIPEARELPQTKLGKIRLAPDARPIITLMKDANASTFLHESGHEWLETLMADAVHPEAPGQLQADARIVRDWLKSEPGSQITVRQHEKFARGIEQYFREGIAPSRSLAEVFAKFRGWLTSIYQTIKGLGAPISPEIRSVFDRMLAIEPDSTVIAPERPAAPSIADIHEEDAREIEPQNAEAGMDRINAERAAYITNPPPEVANEISSELPAAEAAAGATSELGREATAGTIGAENVGAPSGEPELISGGSNVRSEREQVSSGIGAAGAESAGVAAKPNGGGPLAPTPKPSYPTERATNLTDLAGNIRVENLTDAEDIAQAIHESADRNGDFAHARGGVQTKGQINDLADAMNLQPDQVDADTLARLFGGTKDLGARILAARKLVVQSAQIVSDAMKKAAESQSPNDVVAATTAIARHDLIQSALAGVTAEWGRAGSAFHNLMGGWDQAKELNQFLKENTGRDLNQISNLIRLGAKLKDGGQMSKFLRDSTKNNFGRMLIEYWINGLISGGATHITYAVGNGVLSTYHNLVEIPLAAEIGRLRQATGRSGDIIQRGEVLARIAGARRGFAPALKGVVEAIRTGQMTALSGEESARAFLETPHGIMATGATLDQNANMRDVAAAVFSLFRGARDGLTSAASLVAAGGEEGAPSVRALYTPSGATPNLQIKGVPLPVGEAVRLPSRTVVAIHSFYRCLNYSIENSAQAFRQASNERLTGTAFDARAAQLRQNPTDAMQKQSVHGSDDLTLMGQSSKFVQKISSIFNHEFNLPGIGEAPYLKFVDPFVNIGAQILDQSLVKRTPLGILSKQIRADLSGANGNAAQDVATARMLAGTALAITFGGLAAEGFVSDSGPSDPKQFAMWKLAGNQPHSIRIGNIWYQMNRLGPLGMLASVAADMYDVAHLASKDDMSAAGGAFVHAIAQNILDASFMAGPAQWLDAIEHPETDGASFVQNFAASFVPYSVGMQQMARAMDPYTRQTRSILDTIKSRIPGLSETLMPRRDIWGQPIMNNSALGGRGLTAIYEQQISTDPVNLAMAALAMAPAQPDRKIRNVTLSDQQYDDYSRIAGRMAKQRLNVIVNSPDFKTWDSNQQRDVITEVLRQSRDVAQGIILMKYPSLVAAATAARLAKQ